MKYAKIVDKGECMSTLHQLPVLWPEPFLKDVANKLEWAKYGFYPSNDLVAEIPYEITKSIFGQNLGMTIYILRIDDRFYVPMTVKGIEFITQEEYLRLKPKNQLRGMDARQERINAFDDFINSFKFR